MRTFLHASRQRPPLPHPPERPPATSGSKSFTKIRVDGPYRVTVSTGVPLFVRATGSQAGPRQGFGRDHRRHAEHPRRPVVGAAIRAATRARSTSSSAPTTSAPRGSTAPEASPSTMRRGSASSSGSRDRVRANIGDVDVDQLTVNLNGGGQRQAGGSRRQAHGPRQRSILARRGRADNAGRSNQRGRDRDGRRQRDRHGPRRCVGAVDDPAGRSPRLHRQRPRIDERQRLPLAGVDQTSSASSSASISTLLSPVIATPSRGPASTPFTAPGRSARGRGGGRDRHRSRSTRRLSPWRRGSARRR